MFGSGFFILILVSAAIWFWLDGARARELATSIGNELCKRKQLQFLDDTASLSSISLRRTEQGLRIQRVFTFEFSNGGLERHYGSVTVTGAKISYFELGEQTWIDAEKTQDDDQHGSASDNVIPIDRKTKH